MSTKQNMLNNMLIDPFTKRGKKKKNSREEFPTLPPETFTALFLSLSDAKGNWTL